jgi:serine/threonine protein kinase
MSISTAAPGAHIGKYRIVAHIATGGMGAVYKAEDEERGQIVALKILSPDLANNPNLVERFKREARHAARLKHKNIVHLLEWGEVDGLHYLAMEFVEGFDLSAYIRMKGQLEPEEACRILLHACKALEHASAQGIIHRDIKPSNFLLAIKDGRCRVKLTDLGLARMVNDEDFRVTRAGTTVGTVDYLAPEQARDSAMADVRSDIYSLGCTFYQMLAGQPPFAGGGLGERVYKHLAATPADIRQHNPRVSDALWMVLRRMLAKNPDDRYQTPTELAEALQALGRDEESDAEAESSATALSAVPQDEATTKTPLSLPSIPAPVEESSPIPRKSRKTMVDDQGTVTDDGPDLLGVTPDQRRAASAQFTRATEVIGSSGDAAYATQLLLSCCKLEPSNLMYRRMLREVVRDAAGRQRAGWLANLAARRRLRSARRSGQHRKVLEYGEELLVRQAGDVSVQLAMAEAAEALRLHGLAAWLLEEACHQAPKDQALLRTLASLYERQKRFAKAVSVWEQVRKNDPTDVEASTKIKDLAASDTIKRGKFLG